MLWSPTKTRDAANFLKKKTVTPANSAFTLTLPAYSVTAVLLKGQGSIGVRKPGNVVRPLAALTDARTVYYSILGREVFRTSSQVRTKGGIGRLPEGVYIKTVAGGRGAEKVVKKKMNDQYPISNVQ